MRAILASLAVCIAMVSSPAVAQSGPNPGNAAQTGQRHPHEEPPSTRAEIDMQKRQARERSRERFIALKKDTDQLLDLATELKKYVDQANEMTMSVNVIRKAEQIEKLAKSVKEKMRGN